MYYCKIIVRNLMRINDGKITMRNEHCKSTHAELSYRLNQLHFTHVSQIYDAKINQNYYLYSEA